MNDVEVRGFPEYFTRYVEQTQTNSIEEYGDFTGSGKPATPVAIPDSGEVEKGTEIFLSCKTKGANIYYTTDGSIPTSASSLYHKGIKINKDTTIKAIAIKESDILNVSYTIAKEKPQAPTASPNGGVYPEGTLIVLSCETPDSTIYYTTDGSTPTENSLEYIEPIILEENITLKAIAYKEGVKSNITSVNFVATKDRPATPIITPNAGMVEVGTNVSLSCFTQDAIIYYTTDGSTPTEDSYEYISEITLEEDTIIKAVAIKNNRRSEVLTAMFIVIEKPEMPIAIPNGGAIEEGSVVLLSCSTPDTIIYYTTDGTTPTTSSTEYVDGITINENVTIKAIAAKFDICSNVSSFSFIALERPEMPVASPNGGRIKAETPITLSCETPNTTIYYTLDGSTPTIESTEYVEPITFDEDTTIKAISVREGVKSFVMSVDFEIKEKPAMPVISPNGGTIVEDAPVSLSCLTPDSTIYYTTDGSDPTENSTEYTEPFILSENSTVKAIAYKEDVESDIASADFVIKYRPAAPTISPNGGTVINDTPISLSCTTENSTIYYTTDGSDPTTSSTEYVEPFTLSENSTVKAISVKENIESAGVTSASFIVKARPEIPTASQPEGDIPSGSTVALSCATTGATIYYTTDGSEPTSSSTEYTQAIEISADTTLKAIAIKDDIESEILTVSYTVFTQLALSELSDWLAAQDDNTAETPYKLGITGLTAEDLNINTDTGNPGALDVALMSNPTKYVDLSFTEVPSDTTSMFGTFMQCSTIVKSPTIPDGVGNLMGAFYLSTSLKEVTFNINDFSNVTLTSIFNSCTALEDVYVPSMEAKNSLLSKLTSDQDYPSTLDMNEIIKVKGLITCSFDELSETLQDLNNNTATEPYNVIVTNLASEDLGSSSTENTIGNVLQTNNRKFVALANIELPQETTSLSETFEDCSSLVSLDSDLSNVTDLNETFSGCTSLRKVPAIPSGADTLTSTFSGCTSLTEVTLNVEDYSEVETSGMLAGCTALKAITVPSPEAATSLTSKLIEGEDYPSSLDIDEAIVTVVDIEDLDTLLQSLPENTAATPYKLKIEIPIDTQVEIGDVLQDNSTKYVDLSPTEIPTIGGMFATMPNFSYCETLVKSPAIPDGVTDLSYIFEHCTSLTEAPEIPNSVTNMEGTFSGCTSLTETPIIPDSVENMEDTFSGCASLTTAPNIPNAVTDLSYTFSGCISLTEAPEIPDSVENLNYTFSDCTSLVDLSDFTIPSNVTSLSSTFSGCTGLTEAPIIPDSVTDLSYTFQNCSSLTAIPEIPNTVTDLSYTFSGCTLLTTIPEIPESVENIDGTFSGCTGITDISGFTIPSNVTSLSSTFSNCTGLTDVSSFIIPDSVTNLNYTFSGCSSLTTSPTIPDSVTDLSYTFQDCTSLTAIPEIPNTVESLSYTFAGCTGITDISTFEFNENVILVDGLFKGCTGITDISSLEFNEGIFNIDSLFEGCTGLTNLSSFTIPNTITYLNSTFAGCTNLTTAPTLPSAARQMSRMFQGCTLLTTAPAIPSTAENLTEMFKDCTSLTATPSIASGPISLQGMFNGCTSLTTVSEIPGTVTNMRETFKGCTSLTDVSSAHIPFIVTNVRQTFEGCTALTDVSIDILNWSNINANRIFNGCDSLEAINVLTDTAKTTLNNKLVSGTDYPTSLDLNSIIYVTQEALTINFSNLSNSLRALPTNSVSTPYKLNITGLTENNCGSSYTSGTLGYILKQNSTKYVDLSETELPSSSTYLVNIFSGCTNLTSAPEIPSSVTTLDNAFNGCTNLTYASELPNNITGIEQTFEGCTSLTTAPTIPSSVTSLRRTFYGCTSLTDVTSYIADYTDINVAGSFNNCVSLQNIYVPDSTAKSTLISKLGTSSTNFPSTLDKYTVIKVKEQSVVIK